MVDPLLQVSTIAVILNLYVCMYVCMYAVGEILLNIFGVQCKFCLQTGNDKMDCKNLVKRCTGKCKRQYKQVRRSCKKILNRGSVCSGSCTAAVKKFLKDEVGNLIWHCGNPKGILRKIRNAYDKKC